MKESNNRKKALLLIYAYITFLLFPKFHNNKKNNFETYEHNNEIYYTIDYNNKKIYIGSEDVILDLQDDNNIYIVDSRFQKDPNISIKNSYKIRNIYDIENILRILKEYERIYPSNWNRSIYSMELEWIIHNWCHILYINRDHTTDVDLNNNDENTYRLIKK